jgi:hypothetical protein
MEALKSGRHRRDLCRSRARRRTPSSTPKVRPFGSCRARPPVARPWWSTRPSRRSRTLRALRSRPRNSATPRMSRLRYYLKEQGLTTDLQGGGDVNITPQENSQILDSFAQKLIAGAWVPEPYATRLVQAGGKVLVDEHSLWPGGKFPVTVLAVRPTSSRSTRTRSRRCSRGRSRPKPSSPTNATKSQSDVGAVIKAVSGKALDATVISPAWKNLEFTNDPVLVGPRPRAPSTPMTWGFSRPSPSSTGWST